MKSDILVVEDNLDIAELALVSVRLFFDNDLKKLWLFVSRRRGEPGIAPVESRGFPDASAGASSATTVRRSDRVER